MELRAAAAPERGRRGYSPASLTYAERVGYRRRPPKTPEVNPRQFGAPKAPSDGEHYPHHTTPTSVKPPAQTPK